MASNSLRFHKKLQPSAHRNLRKAFKSLQALREKQAGKILPSISRLAKKFQKKLKSLASAEERKRSRAVMKTAETAIGNALLNRKGRNDDEILQPVKAKLTKAFEHSFSKYREIRKARGEYKDEFRDALTSIASDFAIVSDTLLSRLNDLELVPEGVDVFLPPFHVSEINNNFNLSNSAGEHTIADARSGFVSSRTVTRHDSLDIGIVYDINLGLLKESFAGVGVLYLMPATGILKVVIVAQNTRSLLSASLKDNFGFSDGEVDLRAAIYLNVIHANSVGINEREMTSMQLSSGGDDVSKSQANIPTGTPFVITLTSSGAFAKGDPVAIIAGSKVRTLSFVNDMTARYETLVSWQIKEIRVQVI